MPRPTLAALLLTTILLSSCSLIPEMPDPNLAVPPAFKEALADTATTTSPEDGRWMCASEGTGFASGQWWQIFNDPILNGLVEQAGMASPTVQAAAAKLLQAQAQLGMARADYAPQLQAGFGPQRQAPSAASVGAPEGTPPAPRTLYGARGSLSYEVDLLGRVSDAVTANQFAAEAAQAGYENILLMLQADVATTYFDLRTVDRELAILNATLALRSSERDLLERRLEAGYTNELDFQRSESQLQQTQAEMLAVERQRLQLDHRLATLLGKTPADFSLAPLTHEGELAAPPPPPSVPAGLPSQLLERRPDIIAAQQQMAEANARIGVARNAFFPQLNLTASGGFESTELGDLFQWSSRTWVLGPLVGTAVSLPIFEGGRNISRLDFAKAGFDGAVATYRQQVLTAFREVEDDLASLRLLADQAEAQQAAMTASARVAKLSTLRYEEGLVSQLEVIDSQRSLLSAQRALANVEGQRYATTVHLIRALGGGWEQKAAGE